MKAREFELSWDYRNLKYHINPSSPFQGKSFKVREVLPGEDKDQYINGLKLLLDEANENWKRDVSQLESALKVAEEALESVKYHCNRGGRSLIDKALQTIRSMRGGK